MHALRWVSLALLAAVFVIAGYLGCQVYRVMQNPLEVQERAGKEALEEWGFARQALPFREGTLAFWRAGSGPPLLFLHGAGDNASTWTAIAPSFKERWRVVVADLPGHGESVPASGPITMEALVEGTSALVDAAGDEPVTIVGNSLGAWLALLVAHERPERVARVVAVNGSPLAGDPDKMAKLFPDNVEQGRELLAMLRAPESPELPDFIVKAIVRRAQEGALARMPKDFDAYEEYLLDGRLDEVFVPVDLLWGAADGLITLSHAERLEAGMPRARLTPLAACGHVPQLECPDRFLAALEEVLSAPPPANAPEPESSEGAPGEPTGEPEAAASAGARAS